MTTQNYWAFPKEIPLEEVPRYSSIFEKITEPKTIQFDLTKTEWIHSSFIDFNLCKTSYYIQRGQALYYSFTGSAAYP